MKILRKLIILLLVFSVASLIGLATATTESLNVQAGKELVRTIDLAAEDRILTTFTVIGQTSDVLHFWIVFPNATPRDYGEISQCRISFTSEVEGEFELHFNNINSSSTQLVTLNYEVEHYYFGIPQVPFLMLVIILLLLAIVAGYVIMGKYA